MKYLVSLSIVLSCLFSPSVQKVREHRVTPNNWQKAFKVKVTKTKDALNYEITNYLAVREGAFSKIIIRDKGKEIFVANLEMKQRLKGTTRPIKFKIDSKYVGNSDFQFLQIGHKPKDGSPPDQDLYIFHLSDFVGLAL